MLFDIEGVNEGTWFKYQDSTVDAEGKVEFLPVEDSAGEVRIRLADTEFFDTLYKKTRTREAKILPNPANRNTLERIESPVLKDGMAAKERDALWDHWITDFKGLYDRNMKEIPVTVENKIRLMKIPAFNRFVNECQRRLTNEQGVIRKEETDNL